jgi:FlaA1/EpsC-like NDP-sugar epimerase
MRNILFIFVDVFLLSIAFFLSLYFSIEDVTNRYEILKLFSIYYLIYASTYIIYNFFIKNERVLYKFFSTKDFSELIKTLVISNITFILIIFLYDRLENIPRINLVYNILLSGLFLLSVRLLPRFYYFNKFKDLKNQKETVIIGNEIDCYRFIKFYENKKNIKIIGLVLLDTKLSGTLRRVNIIGSINDLIFLIKKDSIKFSQIFLASEALDVSNVSKENLSNLYKVSKDNKKNLYQMKFDEYNFSNNSGLSKLNIENFLTRPVELLENHKNYAYYEDKIILITGCGGSIGSDLVIEAAKHKSKMIYGIDISEENIFNVKQKVKDLNLDKKCMFFVSDIKNTNKIKKIIENTHPEIIIHAAALKHVSISEDNCDEVINTNIFGTLSLLKLYKNYDYIKKFVFVSTDKAVNPSSLMGMTKYIAETLCRQYASNLKNKKFVIVRFGNVLSSSGSVVPIFERQIKNHGPVTVSHPDVNRYFMLINEACSLILLSASINNSNQDNLKTYMLDMGNPVKILDLAKKMIELNSFNADEIEIKITGLKKGEKISEELSYDFEKPSKIENLPIFILKDTKILKNFEDMIDNLRELSSNMSTTDADLKGSCEDICKKIINENEI